MAEQKSVNTARPLNAADRPARPITPRTDPTAASSAEVSRRRAVFVDLNNFSTFPTLAVGILVASLRNAGFQVEVICPLAHDVPAAERERRERYLDHLARRVHLSTHPAFRMSRDLARGIRSWWRGRPHPRVLRETARVLDT